MTIRLLVVDDQELVRAGFAALLRDDEVEVVGEAGDGVLPRVLVLTTFDLDEYVCAALRAGASGFLLKDTRPVELLAAIRVVTQGDALLSPAITRRLIAEFTRSPDPTWRPTGVQLDGLTDREVDVLRLVGTGRTNQQIASELFVSEATVKTHLGRITTKLQLSSRAQAVVVAYQSGLIRAGTGRPSAPRQRDYRAPGLH